MRPAVILPLALLAACTGDGAPRGAADRADAAAVPAAAVAGPAVDCIAIPAIRETHVRSDRVIDFDTGGGRLYRVTLPNACPGLGFERRFTYATSLGQLCSTDIITVLYSSGVQRGASCGLAPFQPVTPPAGRAR